MGKFWKLVKPNITKILSRDNYGLVYLAEGQTSDHKIKENSLEEAYPRFTVQKD